MVKGIVLAAATVLALTSACTDEPAAKGEPNPAPSATVAPTQTATETPRFDPIELRQLRICQRICQITGAIPFDHPKWKHVWLLTIASGKEEGADNFVDRETRLLVVGADRNVLWRWDGGDAWGQFEPFTPATDRTGHLFIRYNPGRYDGLLILAPTATGFNDFGTLPKKDDLPTSRFYSVSLQDDDHDGIFDVREEGNTCNPTCADANYVYILYRWDGHDYTAR
jgi:hypothetical protein